MRRWMLVTVVENLAIGYGVIWFNLVRVQPIDSLVMDAATEYSDILPENFCYTTLRRIPSTLRQKFHFEMPRASHATLKVYDVLGREQATLLNEVVQGGTRSVMWNAEGFASGIYFVRLSVGDVGVTRKVALVK